jgi:hypothetical protein
MFILIQGGRYSERRRYVEDYLKGKENATYVVYDISMNPSFYGNTKMKEEIYSKALIASRSRETYLILLCRERITLDVALRSLVDEAFLISFQVCYELDLNAPEPEWKVVMKKD